MHIRAVKEPWHRSNRFNALSQMLLTNQRLSNLKDARIDFTARGMLKASCLIDALKSLQSLASEGMEDESQPQTSTQQTAQNKDAVVSQDIRHANADQDGDDDDGDDVIVDGPPVLASVAMARTHGKYLNSCRQCEA